MVTPPHLPPLYRKQQSVIVIQKDSGGAWLVATSVDAKHIRSWLPRRCSVNNWFRNSDRLSNGVGSPDVKPSHTKHYQAKDAKAVARARAWKPSWLKR